MAPPHDCLLLEPHKLALNKLFPHINDERMTASQALAQFSMYPELEKRIFQIQLAIDPFGIRTFSDKLVAYDFTRRAISLDENSLLSLLSLQYRSIFFPATEDLILLILALYPEKKTETKMTIDEIKSAEIGGDISSTDIANLVCGIPLFTYYSPFGLCLVDSNLYLDFIFPYLWKFKPDLAKEALFRAILLEHPQFTIERLTQAFTSIMDWDIKKICQQMNTCTTLPPPVALFFNSKYRERTKTVLMKLRPSLLKEVVLFELVSKFPDQQEEFKELLDKLINLRINFLFKILQLRALTYATDMLESDFIAAFKSFTKNSDDPIFSQHKCLFSELRERLTNAEQLFFQQSYFLSIHKYLLFYVLTIQ